MGRNKNDWGNFMRLGEFRAVTKKMDNKKIVKLSCYDTEKGVRTFNLEWDMSNDNEIYLRIVNDERKW